MRLWVELIVSGVITGGIYALVAMGLNLQYGLMRILNVSHGEFLMLGAYLVYWAHVGLALAGAAGALLSMVFEISPSMGEPYTVTALIVIALGGFGSVTGSLLGGLLLGVVEAIGMHLTSPSLKMVLSYGVFMLVLITRPNGLFVR